MKYAALIWCSFPDEAAAEQVAGQLLDEGLVACANIMPSVRSLYIWEGKRGEARECVILFKTTDQLLERAMERLEQVHPYDTPAIVGWLADRCGTATRDWLAGLEMEGS